VRSLGITSHSLKLSLKALELDSFSSPKNPISLINTEVPRSGLLGKARRCNVGLIAMKPLGGGRLNQVRLALGYIYRYRGVVPVVGVETPRSPRRMEQLVRVADSPRRMGARFAGWRTGRRLPRRGGLAKAESATGLPTLRKPVPLPPVRRGESTDSRRPSPLPTRRGGEKRARPEPLGKPFSRLKAPSLSRGSGP
jgi:hypothetical protein